MIWGTEAPKFVYHRTLVDEVEILLDNAKVVSQTPTTEFVEHKSKLTGLVQRIRRGTVWSVKILVHLYKYEDTVIVFQNVVAYLGKEVSLFPHRDGNTFTDDDGADAPFVLKEVTPFFLEDVAFRDGLLLEFESTVGSTAAATGTPPPTLEYLYLVRTDGYVDVVDVHDPTNPSLVGSSIDLALTTPIAQVLTVAEGGYLYVKAFYGVSDTPNKTYVVDIHTDPENPVVVATMNGTGVVNFGPSCGDLIVRTGKTTYNNLLFGWNGSNQITSHDISDPTSPTLIDTYPLPNGGEGEPTCMAFDLGTGKLFYMVDRIGAGGTHIGYVSVNSDGTFSGGSETTVHASVNYVFESGVIFAGGYYLGDNGTGIFREEFNLSGSAYLINYSAHIVKPLLSDGVLILGRTTADTSYYPVELYINGSPYPTQIAHLGSLNGVMNCMCMSGAYLFVIEGSDLLVYDISSPGTPSLVGTLSSLPATPYGIACDPSHGWDGNNGLCTT